MNRERAIIHFNVADFAVAVERVADSALRKRPVIIAPFQAARAVVYDMSEEAFQCGVQKGMNLRQATRLCRGAAVLPPRSDFYQRAMQAFLGQVRDYSPLIEHGKTDGHLFVDVTGTHRLFGPAPDIGWRVRKRARNDLGINPIWTLSANKLVAKVASRLVKPVGEYIVAAGEEEDFLAPLPLTLLPGLSPEEVRRLREFNLVKIGQLAGLNRQQLMVPFGSRSDFLYESSRGIDTSVIAVGPAGTSPVAFEHFFADDTNDRKQLEGVVADLAAKACHTLRGRRQVARRVGIWITYADGGRSVRQATKRQGTSVDFTLRNLALQALQRAWTRRTRIRGCRLVCDRLHRESPQFLLFPEVTEDEIRQGKASQALDRIRSRFGHTAIRTGRKIEKG
jgi:DNA polymerase IV